VIVIWSYNELASDVSATDTLIDLYLDADADTDFIRIADEYMDVVSINNFDDLTDTECIVVRGSSDTTPRRYKKGTAVLASTGSPRNRSYVLEWLEEGDPIDETMGVTFEVVNDGVVVFTHVTNSMRRTTRGVSAMSPVVALEEVNTEYQIRVLVTKLSGIYEHTDTISTGGNTLVAVIDRIQTGYPYQPNTELDTPVVTKDGNLYTVTIENVMPETPPMFHFRIIASVDTPIDQLIISDDVDTLIITPEEGTTYINIPVSFRVASSNITIVAIDDEENTLGTITATYPTPGASVLVDADQIQIQTRAAGWKQHIITDWVANSATTYQYSNIGPQDKNFEFRYRYRTFTRTGSDSIGISPEVISSWSPWGQDD